MKWISTFFFILIFSGITLSAGAQNRGTLKGTVTEKDTGESLPGVNVIIRGTTFGASTDIDGNYEIRNIRPGEYSVEISFVGFERLVFTGIRINEGEVTELNAEIEPVVLTSEDEIIVIGEAPIFDVEKSTSGSTVTRQDIAAAPVRRIEEVLSLQAGVIEDPSGLYIKGGRANETGF
ncbi:MAG TPA: carboxypeptidase-like regulatory domain-containing protein, partial [Balneolaceae bacterium]|nr:carboxypeptidase-like regulatory domain-containing protein [Balneolaceae bacterium]